MKRLLLFLASLPLLALQNGDFSGSNQLNFTGPCRAGEGDDGGGRVESGGRVGQRATCGGDGDGVGTGVVGIAFQFDIHQIRIAEKQRVRGRGGGRRNGRCPPAGEPDLTGAFAPRLEVGPDVLCGPVEGDGRDGVGNAAAGVAGSV